MATDGTIVAGVEYICRVCTHQHTVYVAPVLDAQERPTLNFDGRHKLTRSWCPECDTERTHVAAEVTDA